MKYNLAILGQGISYSLSPKIHPVIGDLINEEITYELKDIERQDLAQAVLALKNHEYQGYNVTKPYKEIMIDHIENLSDVAKKLQAVNTLFIKDGMVYGDNTDVFGFEYLLDYYRIQVSQKRVLILGTGGAAKAVCHVLKERGALITYASRNVLKEMDEKVISYDEINPDDVDIYVNATPIGTYPNMNDAVLKQEQVTNQIIIDLIYRPSQTKLMSFAKTSYNGFVMLLAQAIKSEMLWLNKPLNIHDILDRLKEVIIYE